MENEQTESPLPRKEKLLRKKFATVFGTAEGKEVLDYIVNAICGWNVAVGATDDTKLHMWLGQRVVAKRLMVLTSTFDQKNKITVTTEK